ncbi:MAG TPA: phosphatidylglycerophosphatase A [Acidimicrobiia bacterium]|nr:phosphatidylglycerophosphatase A [Acidimicrobiia bacterium]
MHRIVASWFGSGLVLRRVRGSDAGSGTVGGAIALAMSLALGRLGWGAQLVTALLVIGLSVWSSRGFAHGPDDTDPGWVVVDEAAGTFVATIGLAAGPAIVAWVVFRAADIFKNVFPGVAAAEGLPGGIGITADDVVAGLYGLATGWALTAVV